jgi:hypothetical protein
MLRYNIRDAFARALLPDGDGEVFHVPCFLKLRNWSTAHESLFDEGQKDAIDILLNLNRYRIHRGQAARTKNNVRHQRRISPGYVPLAIKKKDKQGSGTLSSGPSPVSQVFERSLLEHSGECGRPCTPFHHTNEQSLSTAQKKKDPRVEGL